MGSQVQPGVENWPLESLRPTQLGKTISLLTAGRRILRSELFKLSLKSRDFSRGRMVFIYLAFQGPIHEETLGVLSAKTAT